jgi:hypothetical protein
MTHAIIPHGPTSKKVLVALSAAVLLVVTAARAQTPFGQMGELGEERARLQTLEAIVASCAKIGGRMEGTSCNVSARPIPPAPPPAPLPQAPIVLTPPDAPTAVTEISTGPNGRVATLTGPMGRVSAGQGDTVMGWIVSEVSAERRQVVLTRGRDRRVLGMGR